MNFRNPKNGYTESRSSPWLFTLLFGGLYFIGCGLWAPVVLWVLIAGLLVFWMDFLAIPFLFFMNLVFSFLASDLIRNSYLRKGWIEIFDSPPASPSISSSDLKQSEFKKCPFCAEEVRREAIKCKHCGSMLPVVATTSQPEPLVEPGANASKEEELMEQYGITFDGTKYVYKTYRYDKLADAVAYAKIKDY